MDKIQVQVQVQWCIRFADQDRYVIAENPEEAQERVIEEMEEEGEVVGEIQRIVRVKEVVR